MWGPVSSSPPPSTQTETGKKDRGSLLFLLSLQRRFPPSISSGGEIQKLKGEPLDPGTGGTGTRGGIGPGRCTDVSGGVCVRARLKGGGRFPSSSSSREEEKS